MYGKWRIETDFVLSLPWKRPTKKNRNIFSSFKKKAKWNALIGNRSNEFKWRSGSGNKQQQQSPASDLVGLVCLALGLFIYYFPLCFNMWNVLSFRYLLNKLLPRNLLAIWKRAKWQCNSFLLWKMYTCVCVFCFFLLAAVPRDSHLLFVFVFCTLRCFNGFLNDSLFCDWFFFVVVVVSIYPFWFEHE